MKIIPVIGHSNSGKTRFIHHLLEKMNTLFPGEVAVIKHLGYDAYKLEEGKDTTTYFAPGAVVVAGIDAEKANITVKQGTCEKMIESLSDYGIKYTIIEGFKEKGYKKIVRGDLEEDCLLRNPTVDEVINSLDKFDDYFTMQGLVNELRDEADISKTGAMLTYIGIVREFTGDDTTEYLDFDDFDLVDTVTEDIRKRVLEIPGIRGAKLLHKKGRLFAGDDILYIAVAASHRKEGFKALMDAIDEFKSKLH